MSKIFWTILATVLCSAMAAQNINHPTIGGVTVMYKTVSTGTANAHEPASFQVMPETVVSLRADAAADSVCFKMLDPHNNEVLYQAAYAPASAAVTGEDGVKLFYRAGSDLHIGNPHVYSLKLYRYEVYTKDSEGHSSVLFSVTQ